MSLKLTEELYATTIKNDAKTEEELTCQFKTDMGNLMNFEQSTNTFCAFKNDTKNLANFPLPAGKILISF